MGRPHRASLAALLALGALVAAPHRSRADETPPPAPPPPVAPALPSTPESPADKDPGHAAILRAVDEVREEVAKIRGLAWKEKVPAEVISRAQLKKELEKLIQEEADPKKEAIQARVLRRVGLLRDDEDPVAIEQRMLEVGILGFYNQKTKRFYMVEGVTGDAQRPLISHELTHALDDQWFDLEARDKLVKDDADKTFALSCVGEGCAEHTRAVYERAHPDIAKEMQKQLMKQAGEQRKAIEDLPAFLILPTQLHYMVGPAFVDRAVGQDFAGGMQRLFSDMPTTEEQVLHPSKFLGKDRDLPRIVAWGGDREKALGEGWKRLDEEAFGELDFAFWLDRWLGTKAGRIDFDALGSGRYVAPEAKKAAEGWDGIWLEAYEKEGAPLGIVLASAWDTPKDADEAAEALLEAVRRQYGLPAAKWAAVSEGRLATWHGKYGDGRLLVGGDAVYLADGFPADALTRVWDPLAKTTFGRDAKDTYDPAKEADPFEGAAWKEAKGRVAWRSPVGDAWHVEATKDGAAIASPSLPLAVKVHEGGLNQVLLPLLLGLKAKFPDVKIVPELFQEIRVAGHDAARLDFDSRDAAGAASHHVVYVVPAGDVTLVVSGSTDAAAWPAASKDVEAAMDGFIFRE